MRKNAQIFTLSIVAAVSIIFGMVLAGGDKWTPSTLAETATTPAAERTVSAAGAGNLISGNGIGVAIGPLMGNPTTNNQVLGNLIGTNASGTGGLRGE